MKGSVLNVENQATMRGSAQKKKSTQTARAIVAELSDELKDLLRQELFAELDVASETVHRVEEQEVVEESQPGDEDFSQNQ